MLPCFREVLSKCKIQTLLTKKKKKNIYPKIFGFLLIDRTICEEHCIIVLSFSTKNSKWFQTNNFTINKIQKLQLYMKMLICIENNNVSNWKMFQVSRYNNF